MTTNEQALVDSSNTATQTNTSTSPPKPWAGVWMDYATSPLDSQSICTRLMCCPCQCGWSFSKSACAADFDEVMTILFCCPCRTLCGWYPTSYEHAASLVPDEPETVPYHPSGDYQQAPEEEGEEISYDLVFEMERKMRQTLSRAETH
mmetsp:Transcript_15729/g.20517  ORF Transcript_15729/g.20517 Transcript_15729/m.20517 type:complete len:148 (+) Transcript_15729:189-632(+)